VKAGELVEISRTAADPDRAMSPASQETIPRAAAFGLGAAFGGRSTGAVRENRKSSRSRVPGLNSSTSRSSRDAWNPTLEKFTAAHWRPRSRSWPRPGLDLVLVNVAGHGKTYYPSSLLPQIKLGCEDPLEPSCRSRKFGVRFFVSNDFFGDWAQAVPMMKDPEVHKLRLKAMDSWSKSTAAPELSWLVLSQRDRIQAISPIFSSPTSTPVRRPPIG